MDSDRYEGLGQTFFVSEAKSLQFYRRNIYSYEPANYYKLLYLTNINYLLNQCNFSVLLLESTSLAGMDLETCAIIATSQRSRKVTV